MNNHVLAGSPGQFSPHAQKILRLAFVSTAALLLVLSFFLAGRRFGGAFDQPLESAAMLLLGIGFTSLVGCLRMAWPVGTNRQASASTVARVFLPSLAVFLFCYAVTLPGSAPWAVALLWFLVVSEEGTWWLAGSISIRTGRRDVPNSNRPSPPSHSPDDPSALESVELASDVTQQMTRMRDQEGDEVVFGQARGEFAPGERSQCIHLAFCPPLPGNPRITAMHAGGPAAAIAVAQAEPFGARFDVRLSATARQAESVLIEFEARCASANNPPGGD